MLVDAFKKCELGGSVDGCQLLEKSKDVDKAGKCLSEGTVVPEVRLPPGVLANPFATC